MHTLVWMTSGFGLPAVQPKRGCSTIGPVAAGQVEQTAPCIRRRRHGVACANLSSGTFSSFVHFVIARGILWLQPAAKAATDLGFRQLSLLGLSGLPDGWDC